MVSRTAFECAQVPGTVAFNIASQRSVLSDKERTHRNMTVLCYRIAKPKIDSFFIHSELLLMHASKD